MNQRSNYEQVTCQSLPR